MDVQDADSVRIVDKSSLQSSSHLMKIMAKDSILCARPTTFDDSIFSVTSAAVLSVDRTLLRLNENTTLTISHVQSAQLSLGPRIAIMSMMARCFVTIITLLNLLSVATVAQRLFSNSLLKFSGMDKISIGILNVT